MKFSKMTPTGKRSKPVLLDEVVVNSVACRDGKALEVHMQGWSSDGQWYTFDIDRETYDKLHHWFKG